MIYDGLRGETMDDKYDGKPSILEFTEWLIDNNNDVELSPYQLELAECYIDYRNKVFAGGLRTGRTFILDLVKEYYKEKYQFALTND